MDRPRRPRPHGHRPWGGIARGRGAQAGFRHLPHHRAGPRRRDRRLERESGAMTRPATLLAAICIASLMPVAAGAQTVPAPNPLRIEPIDSGFVVAPDARFTSVNDRFATLAGVYGGWLTDRTLLIGAGGYWLANRDDDFEMQYFGGVARWTIGGHRRFGVSA